MCDALGGDFDLPFDVGDPAVDALLGVGAVVLVDTETVGAAPVVTSLYRVDIEGN